MRTTKPTLDASNGPAPASASAHVKQTNKQINKYVTKKVFTSFCCCCCAERLLFTLFTTLFEDVSCFFVLRSLVYFIFFSFRFFFSSYILYANYKLMRCVKIKQEDFVHKRSTKTKATAHTSLAEGERARERRQAEQVSEVTKTLHTFLVLTLSDSQVP